MNVDEVCVKAQAALVNVMNDVTETWMNVLVGQMLEMLNLLNPFAIINVYGDSTQLKFIEQNSP